jgi:hypothetical protein
MRDDAAGGYQGAQRKELSTDNRFQGLDEVVSVNPCIYSPELSSCGEPLQATRLRLVFPGWHERHVANLRITKADVAIRVAILRIMG